jgi:hypothetical protein
MTDDKEDCAERVNRLLNELKEALLEELEEEVAEEEDHNLFPDAPFTASLMVGLEPREEKDCNSQAQIDELRKHAGKLVCLCLTMSDTEAKSLRAALDLEIKKHDCVEVYVSGDFGSLHPRKEEKS